MGEEGDQEDGVAGFGVVGEDGREVDVGFAGVDDSVQEAI